MHELSLAQSIINIVEEEFKKASAKKITEINLKIGKMAGVSIDSLLFGFEISVEDTPLKDAKITINEVPILCLCKDCNKEFSPRSYIFVCSHCKSNNFEILQGRELEIENIIVED